MELIHQLVIEEDMTGRKDIAGGLKSKKVEFQIWMKTLKAPEREKSLLVEKENVIELDLEIWNVFVGRSLERHE